MGLYGPTTNEMSRDLTKATPTERPMGSWSRRWRAVIPIARWRMVRENGRGE